MEKYKLQIENYFDSIKKCSSEFFSIEDLQKIIDLNEIEISNNQFDQLLIILFKEFKDLDKFKKLTLFTLDKLPKETILLTVCNSSKIIGFNNLSPLKTDFDINDKKKECQSEYFSENNSPRSNDLNDNYSDYNNDEKNENIYNQNFTNDNKKNFKPIVIVESKNNSYLKDSFKDKYGNLLNGIDNDSSSEEDDIKSKLTKKSCNNYFILFYYNEILKLLERKNS